MKKFSSFAAAIVLGGFFSSIQAAPATYLLDPSHTFVTLSRDNYGFSNPIIVVLFDEDNPSNSSVQVTLPIAKLDSFVPQLDKELKGVKFFDVIKFPNATYKSTLVQSLGGGKFAITGDLTVRGLTKSLILHADLNKVGKNPLNKSQTIGFEANGVLKRSDFGMNFNVPNVSDEIALKITIQADLERNQLIN